MRTIFLAFVLALLCNAQARAEACPEFFRFVDFGLEAPDGTITRGGATFRAESFAGQAILIRDRTLCRVAQALAVDGRGNPIPVVTSVDYSPEATGLDLAQLRLMRVQDPAAQAERSALEHRTTLERATVRLTRGPTYLCASLEGSDRTSCQLTSPFGGNLALVVYCDPVGCEMPVLSVKGKVIAAARWQPSESALGDAKTLASEIVSQVQSIHDVLAPLSS